MSNRKVRVKSKTTARVKKNNTKGSVKFQPKHVDGGGIFTAKVAASVKKKKNGG